MFMNPQIWWFFYVIQSAEPVLVRQSAEPFLVIKSDYEIIVKIII